VAAGGSRMHPGKAAERRRPLTRHRSQPRSGERTGGTAAGRPQLAQGHHGRPAKPDPHSSAASVVTSRRALRFDAQAECDLPFLATRPDEAELGIKAATPHKKTNLATQRRREADAWARLTLHAPSAETGKKELLTGLPIHVLRSEHVGFSSRADGSPGIC
jgi:hypothetical protein